MREGRLVGAGADAVADRMARLAREADPADPLADPPVDLGEARAGDAERDGVVVDLAQPCFELAVGVREVADDDVLRVVRPVAVGADPDLEQRRLALDDGKVRRGGEGLDPLAGPDEREAERELDLSRPARALAVNEAEPLGGDLRLGLAGADHADDMVHRRGGDLVRESYALDLLLRLRRSCG